jgi:hypothetical protein
MNYAWANPSAGFREQTNQGTPERMLAEAKRTVWLELQELPESFEVAFCQIWRQEPIGTVTVNGPHIDTAKALSIDPDGEAAFAWCDPVDGKRIISARFPGQEVVDQMRHLQNVMNDSKTDVIVYATWPECVVHRSDLEPPQLQDERFKPLDDAFRRPERAGDSPDIDAQYGELESVIVLDDATKVSKVAAWALLDIASLLRETSFDWKSAHDAAKDWEWKARMDAMIADLRPRRLGLWERFVLWVWGSPQEGLKVSVTPPQAGAPDWRSLEELEASNARHADLASTSTSTHLFAPYLTGDLICRCGAAWYEAIHGQNGETLSPRSGGTPTEKETWPEDEQKRYGEDDQSEKRKQAVESRGPAPIDPGKPHVFKWQPHLAGSPSVSDYCEHCGKPQDDPIHGYTGV